MSAVVGRVGSVDVIRSFALLGIVVPNVLFGVCDMTRGTADSACTASPVTWALSNSLLWNKIYLVFAFLLGYTFVLRTQKHRSSLQRIVALLAIGLAHAALLSWFDILVLYALVTILLVALSQFSDRVVAGVASLVLAGYVTYHVVTVMYLLQQPVTNQTGQAEPLGYAVGMVHDGPLVTLQLMVTAILSVVQSTAVVQGPMTLVLALLGMVAARHRLLSRQKLFGRAWSTWVLAGAAWFVPMATVNALGQLGLLDTEELPPPLNWFFIVTPYLVPLTRVVAAFTFIAAVVWLCRTRLGPMLNRVFAPAGQLSATNYITQSVVFMTIYSGYGLGLGGAVPIPYVAAIAVATWLVQLAVSAVWLRYFSHGPIEWCLRNIPVNQDRADAAERDDFDDYDIDDDTPLGARAGS